MGLPFLAEVAVAVGLVALTKAAARPLPGRAVGDGAYAFARPVWALEAAAYLYLTVRFYLKATGIVVDLSDRFREVMAQRRAPARLSGLHESWLSPLLGGRPIDIKDAQWHNFRDGLPLLAAAMLLYLAGGAIVRRRNATATRRQRLRARARYIAATSLLATLVFHQADTFKVLALTAANFAVASALLRTLGTSRAVPVALWTLNLTMLYCNELYHGYSFVLLLGEDHPLAKQLDSHSGMIPWHHIFNFHILRMMSFNLDAWWRLRAVQAEREDSAAAAANAKTRPKIRESQLWRHDDDSKLLADSRAATSLDTRARIQEYHPGDIYTDLVIYYSYLLYLPLYIAGPTITFNDFVSHLAVAQQTYSWAAKVRYAFVRFVMVLLLFEVLNHYLYVGAIAFLAFRYQVQERLASAVTQTPLLIYLTRTESAPQPVLDHEQVVYYSYWALMFLWFKFLLIWRFFRLCAVLDDIEPVENMERCMNNNYTIGGFWRSWHKSFNRWLIRYVYVPLGGGQGGLVRRACNILLVFTFVAFWHDIKPELFAWGWLLSLFFVPEILAQHVAKKEPLKSFMTSRPLTASWLVAFCGACNIVMLKIANIVGYSTGVEGAALLIPALQTRQGIMFALEYLLFMTVGVQIMLFIADTRASWAQSPPVPRPAKTASTPK